MKKIYLCLRQGLTSGFYEAEPETCTEVMVLFGHRAAIYMKDYNGYLDLKEVQPV
ncbi:hypothetical protein LVD17_26845 [Fulvivirga ulvae]|uniref:hypothetical protein n=1 Tax=Fulvivirga ulvae TaxID=2904245 RepID=UPI001F2698BD|nr:hypothetical protein [Fulvivirga ulvae]UII31913.1 hypothetical protein LVD17_26845 [Fulvivirga ulvae]